MFCCSSIRLFLFPMKLIRHYYTEGPAQVAAARLEAAGIRCFVSNTLSATAFPLTSPAIGLYINETDLSRAATILQEMDEAARTEPDYREADHADIEFARSVNEGRQGIPFWVYAMLLVIVSFLIWRVWNRAADGQPAWEFLGEHPQKTAELRLIG